MLGLTFLGTSDYHKVIYKYHDNECETHLFPIALAHFFSLQQLKVVVTKEAKQKHYGTLEQQLKNKIELQAILVPYGQGEKDLWEMFTNVINSIPEKSELIVDITHGFRALPILALSICMYLRLVRKVNILKITYGAFEAPDPVDNKRPVWDLTPFLFLMDWNLALDKFLNTGNAKDLSDLLDAAQRKAWKQAIRNSVFLPTKLQNLSHHINNLSDALMTVRTFECLERATSLKNSINNAEQDIEQWAKPFLPLLQQVKYEYTSLAAEKGHLLGHDGLSAQYEMIQWYKDKKHYQQTITLAREWLISKMCLWLSRDASDFGENGDRNKMENELGDWASRIKKGHTVPGETNKIANDFIAHLWLEIVQARNDMNHAGMRSNPMPSTKIIAKVDEICNKLKVIEYGC